VARHLFAEVLKKLGTTTVQKWETVMGIINFILLAIAGTAPAGCVSSKVTTSATAAVKFHQLPTVKLIVTESVEPTYAKERLPMFENLMKERVPSLGHALLEADPEMVANVPGDQSDEATRMGMISYSVSQIGEFVQNHGREKK
jgi:hypothetical protein